MNSLDQELKKTGVQKLYDLSPYQSHRNAPVVSDDTVRRALDGWNHQSIRKVSNWLYGRLNKKDKLSFTLPSGQQLKVGVVDSSSFGNTYSNCITAVSDENTFPLDLQAHKQFKRGKELPAARTLIDRWQTHFDLLAFDGLYLTEDILKRASNAHNLDILVKYRTNDERENDYPWPLENCEWYFKRGIRHEEKIVDEDRDVEAQVYWCKVNDRGHKLTVCKFQVNDDEKEDFFVVTTRRNLEIEDIWELTYRRWAIENNAFRSLSNRVDSKGNHRRGGVRLKPEKKFTLIFWSLLFMSIFRYLAATEVDDEEFANVKVTEDWIFHCVKKYWREWLNAGRASEP